MPPATVRRKPKRGVWLPNQHGAWAMLLAPLGLGIALSGPTWAHVTFAIFWLVGYFAFFAAGLYLRSRGRRKYVAPMLTYGGIAAVFGLATLAFEPSIVIWIAPYVPLFGLSLWCSYRRLERTIVNDTATVLAACLACLVATALGSTPRWEVSIPVALALFGYFEGTIFYVKTMIRDRGSKTMYRISVGYHAAYCVASAFLSWWLAGFAVLTLVRAAVLAGRPLTPKQVGLIEVAFTCVLVVLALSGTLSW